MLGGRPRRTVATGTLLLGLLGLLVVSCTSDDTAGLEGATATSGGSLEGEAVLRLGLTTGFQFDTARAVPTEQGHMMAIDLLYDGLTAMDPEAGEPVPALAGEWRSNDDFTEWTFDLRDDAVFSDGTPITGQDVRFSLEHIARRGTASLAGVRLGVIKGYEKFVAGDVKHIAGIGVTNDGHSVHISTSQPFAPLPELLSSPIFGVLPRASADAMKSDDPDDPTGPFFDAPIGSGAFMMAGEAADTAATAERPEGSDRVVVLTPAPGADVGLDAVQLVHFDELGDSYQAFKDGALDFSLVPSESVDQAVDQFGEDAMSPFHAEFFYGINVGKEAYEDPQFREAIVRAVDRSAIVEEFYPSGIPLNGTVVQGVPGYQDDPCGDPCAYSPDEARSLLEDAFGDDEPPEIKLDFYEGERERSVAEAVRDDLAAVGLTVKLRPHDPTDYEKFVTSGDQEVFLFGWVGIAPTADSYLAPLFLSESPDNVTSFGAQPVDAAIALARFLPTEDERTDAYQAVEETVMSTVPVIPLVQVRTLGVVASRVSGWQPQLDGTFVVTAVSVGG